METPLYLKVLLWGHEIGRLTWRDKQKDCYFVFNPENITGRGKLLNSPNKNKCFIFYKRISHQKKTINSTFF